MSCDKEFNQQWIHEEVFPNPKQIWFFGTIQGRAPQLRYPDNKWRLLEFAGFFPKAWKRYTFEEMFDYFIDETACDLTLAMMDFIAKSKKSKPCGSEKAICGKAG